MGPEDDSVGEIKFLGRRIRWTATGIEWEGDQKHVERYIEKIGLQQGKAVETPGVKHDDKEVEDVAMTDKETTEYRGLVALLNFMAQDRPDLAFASKEASKSMSSPMKNDMMALKRVGRYLQKYPRGIMTYAWQQRVESLTVYTDSDWGGDIKTRKSTSGGCILRGLHLIGHWCRTQQSIALSSCEAELNGICKAAMEGLGARNLTVELGIEEKVEIRADASAAVGVVQRKGAGKIKHLEVKQLWVQEHEKKRNLKMTKIPREVNWADLFTHHWSSLEGEKYLAGMGLIRRGVS